MDYIKLVERLDPEMPPLSKPGGPSRGGVPAGDGEKEIGHPGAELLPG